MTVRTYSELMQYTEFVDRFRFLSLGGLVGESTFGFDRWINQNFYTSREWRQVRQFVIARDLGLDLASPGHEIWDKVIIHHMNPMQARDIVRGDSTILDPEYLITTCHETHNAIHYGDESLLKKEFVFRRPGDTKLR